MELHVVEGEIVYPVQHLFDRGIYEYAHPAGQTGKPAGLVQPFFQGIPFDCPGGLGVKNEPDQIYRQLGQGFDIGGVAHPAHFYLYTAHAMAWLVKSSNLFTS